MLRFLFFRVYLLLLATTMKKSGSFIKIVKYLICRIFGLAFTFAHIQTLNFTLRMKSPIFLLVVVCTFLFSPGLIQAAGAPVASPKTEKSIATQDAAFQKKFQKKLHRFERMLEKKVEKQKKKVSQKSPKALDPYIRDAAILGVIAFGLFFLSSFFLGTALGFLGGIMILVGVVAFVLAMIRLIQWLDTL